MRLFCQYPSYNTSYVLVELTDVLSSTAYCWGNFAGPFVVKPSEAPEYKGATIGLLVGYAIKAGCHICLFRTYNDVFNVTN